MKPVVRVVWISRANVFLLIFLGAKLKFTMAGEKFSVCEMTSKCYAGRRFFDRDMPAFNDIAPDRPLVATYSPGQKWICTYKCSPAE